MNIVDRTIGIFLAAAQRHTNQACEPNAPDFAKHCAFALAFGEIAYVLETLQRVDRRTAERVALDMDEFADDGEPLANWVAAQLNQRGIEVPS